MYIAVVTCQVFKVFKMHKRTGMFNYQLSKTISQSFFFLKVKFHLPDPSSNCHNFHCLIQCVFTLTLVSKQASNCVKPGMQQFITCTCISKFQFGWLYSVIQKKQMTDREIFTRIEIFSTIFPKLKIRYKTNLFIFSFFNESLTFFHVSCFDVLLKKYKKINIEGIEKNWKISAEK